MMATVTPRPARAVPALPPRVLGARTPSAGSAAGASVDAGPMASADADGGVASPDAGGVASPDDGGVVGLGGRGCRGIGTEGGVGSVGTAGAVAVALTVAVARCLSRTNHFRGAPPGSARHRRRQAQPRVRPTARPTRRRSRRGCRTSTASTCTPGTETAQPDESSTTAWVRGPLELAATAAPLVVTVMAPMTPTADTRASNFVAARSSLTRITRVLLALRPLDESAYSRPMWFLGNAATYLLS